MRLELAFPLKKRPPRKWVHYPPPEDTLDDSLLEFRTFNFPVLTPTERLVLMMKQDGMNNVAAGQLIGLKRDAVRRVHRQALAKVDEYYKLGPVDEDVDA